MSQILQIYKGEVPLTLTETARLIHAIKDEELQELANDQLTDSAMGLPRRCDNSRHKHYKKNVGGGICLAKKYKRLVFTRVDKICAACESNVITNTLNYLFNKFYGGEYRAEWRSSRRNRSFAPPKSRKKKTEITTQTELRPQPIKETKEVKPPEPQPLKIVAPTRNRRIQGRQGRVLNMEA